MTLKSALRMTLTLLCVASDSTSYLLICCLLRPWAGQGWFLPSPKFYIHVCLSVVQVYCNKMLPDSSLVTMGANTTVRSNLELRNQVY